jgi:hypothetical protein
MTSLQATRDIRKVALWLGHSSLKSTEIYPRADPTEKLNAIEKTLPLQLRRGVCSRSKTSSSLGLPARNYPGSIRGWTAPIADPRRRTLHSFSLQTTGEGDEALGGACVAADAGEAVGEDAAAEVGAEVVLHPARYALAVGIGFGGVGQEALEVVLHDGVEGRGRGLAAAKTAVRPSGRGLAWPCGNTPRRAAQPVRVGVGMCMARTGRRRAGRWNGGVGQGCSVL